MPTNGRLVIVTGGSRGLGLATVAELLERGYFVATCSRESTDAVTSLNRRYEGHMFWARCTIGVEAQEGAFFSEVLAWAGSTQLYGLVNNAGVTTEGILATFPNVESEHIINVNLLGALRLSRLAMRRMLAARKGGRIVNVSSIIGQRGYTGLAAHSASKAGMDGLTRALARESGRRNITVNSVAPGYLKTDLSASLASSQVSQIIRRTPLGRLGTVGDIVPVIAFLLSDDASFVTGQTIVVDGGISS